mmetsp:Transcript_46372/g.149493  ORF Transcript_46372/g.149493 Transcript_46372/m.149493 type:complete len:181 (+) Transcript_46372:576-1118(+)
MRSGTRIHVSQKGEPSPVPGERVVTVTGTPAAVQKGKEIIWQRVREIESEGAARAGIGGYNPETAYGGQAYKPPPQPAHLVNHPQYQTALQYGLIQEQGELNPLPYNPAAPGAAPMPASVPGSFDPAAYAAQPGTGPAVPSTQVAVAGTVPPQVAGAYGGSAWGGGLSQSAFGGASGYSW